MPLPTVDLDDRRFEDIVEQARRLIPQICPDWTDHHVSDPGVALIEVFAWMTDLLLYRVNQVPQKTILRLLDLIGVTLDPPRAAGVDVTFYLGAPATRPLVIPAGTEVATTRTEGEEAVVFSTETAFTLRPPRLRALLSVSTADDVTTSVARHDPHRLGLSGRPVPVFHETPAVGDSFNLCFEQDHGQHVLALVMSCETAGGAGVDPDEPPFMWEVWQGGTARWVSCVVELDGTRAFNVSGELVLRLPAMSEEEFHGERGYWLRCRLTGQQRQAGYRVSPDLERLHVETRGATVPARHASTVEDERLGRSDGTPGQVFRLLHAPVLALDPETDVIESVLPGQPPLTWHSTADFADAGPDAQHFHLDLMDGTVTFGPALPQPDGTVGRFGAVPPAGSVLRFRRYRHGGGLLGNVSAHRLSVCRSSLPCVARVTNHVPARGGRDAQPLEDALLKVPRALRTRTRAVTADDYEQLAGQIEGVARARCVTPRHDGGGVEPGGVRVVVLHHVEGCSGRIAPEQLTLSADLRGRVQNDLAGRAPLGVFVDVAAPQLSWVSVRTLLRVSPQVGREERAEVREQAERELYRYLNPYVGGPLGQGWPFGRALSVAELYSLLRALTGVEYVEDVQVLLTRPFGAEGAQAIGSSLHPGPQGLIVSDTHHVRVE